MNMQLIAAPAGYYAETKKEILPLKAEPHFGISSLSPTEAMRLNEEEKENQENNYYDYL